MRIALIGHGHVPQTANARPKTASASPPMIPIAHNPRYARKLTLAVDWTIGVALEVMLSAATIGSTRGAARLISDARADRRAWAEETIAHLDQYIATCSGALDPDREECFDEIFAGVRANSLDLPSTQRALRKAE